MDERYKVSRFDLSVHDATASQLERESVTVMTLMLRRDGIPPQFEIKMPLPGSEREWQSVIPVFCVSVDAQGQITLESGENVKVSEDVVEQAVEQVLASGAQRGKLSDLGLRFLVETNKDGETQIAFSDLSCIASTKAANDTRCIVPPAE